MDYAKLRREYQQVSLSMDDLDPDPMKEFEKWFDLAFKVYGEDCNAMTLATADSSGQPSARTVLLKGVTPKGFLFFTNYHSRKGRHLEKNPQAAILFYWGILDRQIRIEGSVHKVESRISDDYFASRPRGSQISAVVSPQSLPINMEDLQEKWKLADSAQTIERPQHWGGYEIKAKYFEFWNGRENRLHDRFVYEKRKDGSFELYRIAP